MGEIVVGLLKLGVFTGAWLIWLWVGGAVVTAWVATEKDRSPAAWFVIAVLLSPLLALVALGAVPRKEPADMPVRQEARATTVRRMAAGW
jgi:hypothetical protein